MTGASEIAALFQRLTQGVYVIGVADGSAVNAFTAVWVMQASYRPLRLVLAINAFHASFRVLEAGRVFSVNVLKRDQGALAAHFGRPAADRKLDAVAWSKGITGTPLLADALAWFECRVTAELPAGSHVLVLGEVVGGRLLDAAAEPLLYRDTGSLDGAAALYPDDFGET